MIERAVFVSYCHADAAWLDRVNADNIRLLLWNADGRWEDV